MSGPGRRCTSRSARIDWIGECDRDESCGRVQGPVAEPAASRSSDGGRHVLSKCKRGMGEFRLACLCATGNQFGAWGGVGEDEPVQMAFGR